MLSERLPDGCLPMCAPPRIVHAMVQEAARLTGIPAGRIISADRQRDVFRARAAICHVARQRGRTTTQIGTVLNRDHSSVVAASRAAVSLKESDPHFALLCLALEKVQ